MKKIKKIKLGNIDIKLLILLFDKYKINDIHTKQLSRLKKIKLHKPNYKRVVIKNTYYFKWLLLHVIECLNISIDTCYTRLNILNESKEIQEIIYTDIWKKNNTLRRIKRIIRQLESKERNIYTGTCFTRLN